MGAQAQSHEGGEFHSTEDENPIAMFSAMKIR
jgi:hypothetical protein